MHIRNCSLALLATFALTSCGSKDLTKDMAKEVLVARPRIVRKKVQIAPVLDLETFRKLEKDGYVTLAASGPDLHATPTDKLKPYLVGPAKMEGGNSVMVVKVAQTTVQEVTGVAPVEGDPAARIVDYTVKVEPTPIAAYVGARKAEGIVKRKAYFKMRDGEWRLTRKQK